MKMMLRKSILAAAATFALGATGIGSAALAETVLRVVPHASLKILDPIWTTA